MKILIVNTFYYPNILGGAEISVKKMAEGLAERGYEVHILCTGKNDLKENINGVNIHRIKPINVTTPLSLGEVSKVRIAVYRMLDFDNKLNKMKFKKVINEINPDIAHINNIPGISISIWDVLKEKNIPIIHTLRDYYLLCPKINLLKKCEICDKKNSVCKFYTNYKKKVFNMDTCITAPSKATLKVFKDSKVIDEKKDTKVIYNAIDFDFNLCEKINRDKMEKTDKLIKFVYIGSLHKHKGIKWLINSFQRISNKNIELHIAGEGPLKDYLLEKIDEDLRIKYHGFLKEKDVNNLLEKCDVSIVSSIWYEPFGRVVIDAYKNGLPVIGSDIGGISEIINNNETGLLVEPNSEEELKKAIIKFTDRDYIKSMLNNCIEILPKFSINNQLDDFESVYKKYSKKGRKNGNF